MRTVLFRCRDVGPRAARCSPCSTNLRAPTQCLLLPSLFFATPVHGKCRSGFPFGIAVFLCAVGLAWLPGADLEKVFMVMGYVFCLSATFMLSKFVRDNQSAGAARATPRCGSWWCGAALRWPWAHWLGPGGHGDQRHLQGLFGRELAVPSSLRPSRWPRCCATATRPT